MDRVNRVTYCIDTVDRVYQRGYRDFEHEVESVNGTWFIVYQTGYRDCGQSVESIRGV